MKKYFVVRVLEKNLFLNKSKFFLIFCFFMVFTLSNMVLSINKTFGLILFSFWDFIFLNLKTWMLVHNKSLWFLSRNLIFFLIIVIYWILILFKIIEIFINSLFHGSLKIFLLNDYWLKIFGVLIWKTTIFSLYN